MVGHLVCHVFEGAVRVGAFAQVVDAVQVPDEVGLGGEGAENILSLGVLQTTDGPRDPDLSLVLLLQPLGKYLCELSDASEQLTGRRLLQRDGL